MKLNIGMSLVLIGACLASACTDNSNKDSAWKEVAFVAGDGVFNDKFIEIGGEATKGAYIITPYVNDVTDKGIKAFSDNFAAKFKGEPDAWAALTYDAVGTFAQVIAKVGTDRQKIRDGLAAMNTKETGYSGVTGITYFDQNGDCVKPAIVATTKDGKFTKADVQMGTGAGAGVVAAVKEGKKPTGEPIVIGVAGPFTGQNQAFGDMIRKGAELKIEEINKAGGINGRPLQAKWGDDEGVNGKAVNVSKDLASDPKVVAVVGHFNSTCSLAAKPEYTRKKIPMLSPGSTNVKVCEGSDYAFRNLYRDDFQGQLIAKFLKEKLKKTKVVVFYDNDDYGKGLKKYFVKEAKKLGLEVLEEIPYNRAETNDFKPLVTKAKYKNPDAIFVAGLYEQAAIIAKAARNSGMQK
ncbi:MAG: ABC transporter substrate-binding protein [Planctomycetota bacterium]|nr:ABC transporter substrate-binding protein [Planctomycetota bacterium]